jgi:small neutral amino acid transporter SnatA (MarC family)
MPVATKNQVVRKMLTTAATAVALLVLGGLLTRLLHFSAGALGIPGGIVLLIIAISMILSPHDQNPAGSRLPAKDPMQLAVFPLAVLYLLNPAGIVTLVTASAEGIGRRLRHRRRGTDRGDRHRRCRVPVGQPGERAPRREPHARN